MSIHYRDCAWPLVETVCRHLRIDDTEIIRRAALAAVQSGGKQEAVIDAIALVLQPYIDHRNGLLTDGLGI